MSSTPIKFISAGISNVSVKETTTVAGVPGIASKWTATLTVVAQAHSNPGSTPVPNFYTGRNVVVGDWVTSDSTGKALRVTAVTSQTDQQVICDLEDVDSYNAMSDETGNLDGMIPNGPGIGAYVFEVRNAVPLLANIPASLPGNLAGTDFANNIQSRFAQSSGIGLDANGNLVLLGGPGNLNTAAEIAAALNYDPAAFATLSAAIASQVATEAASRASGDSGLSAQIAAINAKVGAANGIASLDATGKIPTSQIPGSVDQIEEYANLAAFPATGATGKMYVALDTNKVYRWSGSAYIEISSGGTADAATKLATPRTISLTGAVTGAVAFDGSANVAIATTLVGAAPTATKLATARTITLAGDVTGSVAFDGSANVAIATTLAGAAPTATKLATARTITLAGDASGSVAFDGSANVTLNVTVAALNAVDGGSY